MEILFVKDVNKGAFKCTVDVCVPQWGNFIIRRIKVFEKGSDQWISFPSETYEKDGKTQYYAYNMFKEPDTMKAFQTKLLAALKERKATPPQKASPSSNKQTLFDDEVDFII